MVSRLLSVKEEFSIILHEECRKESLKTIISYNQPIPEMEWVEEKTSALSTLHEYLSNENIAESWVGPGLNSFRKILKKS